MWICLSRNGRRDNLFTHAYLKCQFGLLLPGSYLRTAQPVNFGEIEYRHPSEVRHLHFIAILKSFSFELSVYMYTLLLKSAISFI